MKKVFHVLMASAVFAFAAGGEAAQIAFKKFESIPGGEAEVASFVCAVASGVYSPGESVEVRLKVKAAVPDVSVALQVRNFAGREIYRSGSRKLTEEMRTESFLLPPSDKFDFFTVSALFSHNARIVGYTETAYAVAPPPTELEDRDVFFVVDKNFALPELLPEKLPSPPAPLPPENPGSAREAVRSAPGPAHPRLPPTNPPRDFVPGAPG
jgi:hypothetical protein